MAVTMSQVQWVDVPRAAELDSVERARYEAEGYDTHEAVCHDEAEKYT